MSDGFYRAFVDKHRGSLALIKERQRAYLPFIEPLSALYGKVPAIDLGCGRGEWLELLNEAGFDARGVDLDDGMLAECRARGLNVKTQDAVAALKECADSSQAVVSGFHLAEHIPFEVLQELVREALRVLMPAGLLILETPNPENIVVGTANFYLDPTHRQPIPPLLLSFVPEYLGFERVKTIRLQSPVSLDAGTRVSIHDVLGGVSPDYAVIAQKQAAAQVIRAVSAAFTPEYGVTLDMVAGRYDEQINVRLHLAEEKVQQAEIRLGTRVEQVMDTAIQALHKAEQANHLAEHAASRAHLAEVALHAIYHSSSWRVTAPLRWAGTQRRLLRERGVSGRLRDLAKKLARPVLARGIAYFDARPELRARYSGVAGKQGLYDQLRAAFLRISPDTGLTDQADGSGPYEDSAYAPELTACAPTVHAQEIYKELKAAIEHGKEHQ